MSRHVAIVCNIVNEDLFFFFERMKPGSFNYRRDTQKSVGFYVDIRFLKLLNAHLRRTRVNKSQFIRDAVAEKLRREGVHVSENIVIPLPPYSEETDERPEAK